MKSVAQVHGIQSSSRALTRVGWISFFALLTGLGAWVRIPLPFTPVPITLQTAVVLSSGVILGRDGIYAMLLYLLLGGLGLPLFAGDVPGAMYLLGSTGGYLIGFVAAAAITARWIHPNWATDNFIKRSVKLFLVSLVVFVPGVLQLALVMGISLQKAFLIGCLPFLLGDVIKCAVVGAIPKRTLR